MVARDILIATVLAPHGVRGWLKLHWHGENSAGAAQYKSMHDKSGRVFEVTDHRAQGKSVQVKFAQVNDRNAAAALHGTALFIPRAHLPPQAEDEFYHVDLIGLAAQTPAGAHLGVVKAVQNFGAGDLLEIANLQGESQFYPFSKAVIVQVDLDSEIIVLNPPRLVE